MTLQPKTRVHQLRPISYPLSSRHNLDLIDSKDLPEYLTRRFVIAESGCWDWHGKLNDGGYGQVNWDGRRHRMAHKVVYQLLVGEIPEGLEIDHLCKNRRCVNPAHLEAVTRRENLRRSDCESSKNRIKTHCPKGHEYSEANTIVNKGKRYCRACAVLAWSCWNAKRRKKVRS